MAFDPSRYLDLFVLEAREHLAAARKLVPAVKGASGEDPRVRSLFRHFHSLRGMSACMGFEAMTELADAGENVLAAARDRGHALDSRRGAILLGVLDTLGRLLEEARTGARPTRGGALVRDPRFDREGVDSVDGKAFSRFAVLADLASAGAADAASRLGRSIRVRTAGEDLELGSRVCRDLVDAFVHLARNAVDHGIETPADRVARGKPAEGTLSLAAERTASGVRITLEDDGRGMDGEALRRAAVRRRIVPAEQAVGMGSDAVCELALLPGLTTTSRPAAVSGRGVGLDVVARSVERLGGRLSIRSRPGNGTRIEIDLPFRRGAAR